MVGTTDTRRAMPSPTTDFDNKQKLTLIRKNQFRVRHAAANFVEYTSGPKRLGGSSPVNG